MSNSFLLPYEIYLLKAKQDLTLVQKNISDNEIAPELIFFHLQQAIEKALKAILDFHGVKFKKTHDLNELVESARENGIAMPNYIDKLCELTPYSVEARYAMLHDDLSDATDFLNKTEQLIVEITRQIAAVK